MFTPREWDEDGVGGTENLGLRQSTLFEYVYQEHLFL